MKRHDLLTRIMARAIGTIAPKTALRYAASRAALSAYIGAGGNDHNAHWRPTRKSADAILRTDATALVARARSLERNYVNVAGALRKICDNVVHTGIKPQFTDKSGRALDDLEASFASWCKLNKFYVVSQKLALRHWWVDGEIFANLWVDARRLRSGHNPLRVEMLEQDLVDSSKDGALDNGGVIRRGVQFDRYGDVVGYHILTSHPGDYLPGVSLDSVFLETARVVHLWMPQRASQSRGVSLLAPIVEEIKDLSEYKASERVAARLASAFGLFIKTTLPELGAAQFPQRPGAPGAPGVGSAVPTVPAYLETGRIQTLPPGTEVQVAEASRPASPYSEYVKSSNKDASVGFGLRYGNYSHDYTESSFSSERSAALDERRGWIGQQLLLQDGWCDPICRRWLEIEYATGRTDIAPEDVVVIWQAPGWPWVDPVKDATASEKKLQMRVTTRRSICAEMGTDFDETLAQLAREEAAIAKAVPTPTPAAAQETQGAGNATQE